MAEGRLLVPVAESITLRATVSEVVAELEEGGNGTPPTVHFVYIATWREDDPDSTRRLAAARDLLEQVERWAEYDLDDVGEGAVTVETSVIGQETYLFGPSEMADVLYEYAIENDLNTVVVDPEYSPVGNAQLLQPLEFELSQTDLTVREAPVERPQRRERLVRELTGTRFAAVFGISLVFYLLLGDPTYWFDWVTGVASAAIVAITLSQVTFGRDPALGRSVTRTVRFAIYVPVLLWEIVKANVAVAVVILSPFRSVEPTMTRVRSVVGAGLPLTTLANSITLTPGTLTVRARNQDLYVHALIPWAREGLFEGGLERWTRFVFYGREAARIPRPDERDDTAILQGPDAEEQLPSELGNESASRTGDEEVTEE